MARTTDNPSREFDQVSALTSELETLRIQSAEIEGSYQKKVRQLERELESVSQKLRAQGGGAAQIDPVEHQAMRQELETLRQTVRDLQQELEEANHQSQQGEDALEDKNDQIERLGQEVDMLRGDMEEAEYKRREAEEAKKQIERSLYQIQEEMDRMAASREAVRLEQLEANGGKAKPFIAGTLLGMLLLLGIMEGFSFSAGKGELVALLRAEPTPRLESSPDQPALPATPATQPPVTEASPAKTEETPRPAEAVVAEKVDPTPPVEQAKPNATAPPPVKAQEPAASENPAATSPPPVEAPLETPAVPAQEKVAGGTAPESPKVVEDDKTGITLISLQGGRFTMGNRSGVAADETPAHEVILKPFLIGQREVSFKEYDTFAKATGRTLPNDEGWGRGDHPVINVTWEDATAYVEWLSLKSGHRYRLPSETEWEYAAAAGTDSAFWWGYQKGVNNANCFNCGSEWDGRTTSPVVSLQPNAFGLYNTAGNVQEWVQDCYKSSYLNAPTDGSAVEFKGCGERVARGGAFNKPAASMRTTKRSRFVTSTSISSLGLRVVREP